jgi:hypothetical protein
VRLVDCATRPASTAALKRRTLLSLVPRTMVDGEPLILHVYATVCMFDQRARANELVIADPRQSATAPLGSRSACRSWFLCRLHAWCGADGGVSDRVCQ